MMKKRIKTGSAVVLALALAFSALPLLGTKAANAVETGRTCSVEFVLDTNQFDEMDDIAIPIKLYKVADINKSGEYTAVAGFESVDFSSVAYDEKASAAEWLDRAEKAAERITKDTVVAGSTTTVQGKATISNLDTGMYLVVGEETNSDYYTYSFTPYLISLPNNYYYTSSPASDEWVYDLKGGNAIGLKPEQEKRLGSLTVTKSLDKLNNTMGSGATFIVKVEMLQLDGKTREDRLVTLTFNGYGEGSVSETITGIPAGTEIISVKEVYTGASYTQGVITTDGTKNKNGNVIIVADDSESAKATITVNNTHDGRPNGGYGVVNRVEANGTGYEQIDKVTPKVEE